MKMKRLTALLMSGVMCMSFVGCSKKESSSKKKEELSYYKLSQEEEFDTVLSDVIISDKVIYGSYYKEREDVTDEEGYYETYGIIKYDLNTKEKAETELDMDTGYVRDLYLNQTGELVVNAQRYINSGKTGEVSDEDVADEEFSYTYVTYVYNADLELISKDESEIKTESYDSEISESEEMIYDTSIDNEGNFVKLVTKDGDKYYISVEDQDGNEQKRVDLEDLDGEKLIKMSDGSYLIVGWESGDGEVIYKVDFEGEKLGDKFVETKSLFNIQGIYAGEGNTLLMNLDGYLNICDGDTGKISKVLKYMDSDVDYDYVNTVFVVDENTYGIIVVDWQNSKSEIDFLTKASQEEVANKKEIHIATLGMSDDIKQRAIQFNKTSDEYKIVIDEYLTSDIYSSETGYNDAIKKFNSDITSDGGPDIIDLNSINIKQYSDKGVFEDITPYLEKDSELSEDDFIESVLDAYRDNGKLYAIPLYVDVECIAGKKSQIGEDISWTLKDFIDYAESLPEGMDIFNNVTSEELLYTMIAYNMDDYIDWKTGNCNFNSDEFVKLLELCSQYKTSEEFYAEYDDDEDWENEPSEVTKIKNNKVALQQLWLSSNEEYQIAKMVFGDDLSIKGYPTSEGNGIALSASGSMLAISSKSKYKDVAWDFVRQLYKYDDRESYYRSFPTKKTELDKMFEELKNNATLQTAPDGTEYYTQWSFGDDAEFYIPIPTEEEINEVKAIIDSADKVISYSEQEIYSILTEETESFFKGEKTASEVADVIQSRVSIYVKENK